MFDMVEGRVSKKLFETMYTNATFFKKTIESI
jgi:hypothetical protein